LTTLSRVACSRDTCVGSAFCAGVASTTSKSGSTSAIIIVCVAAKMIIEPKATMAQTL
jgi:hypothetical protein